MLKNRTIAHSATILEALKKMDALDKKLLIVLDNECFAGLLSIGDIQRAIIKNQPLDSTVTSIQRKKIRVATPGKSFDEIKTMMLEFRMELCPVVDESNKIIKVYYWEDLFVDQKIKPQKQFSLPVVIMAGGFGSRLKPLTNVIPKPLIPISEKTIIEDIFERFAEYGCRDFFVSLNYKADLIKYYVDNQKLPFNITYITEDTPLGTAGSLSMLKDTIKQTFFISNCDILIEQDYSEILDYHVSNKNDLTIVAALRHYPIPYGTIETAENGQLVSIQEKPELTFKINSGVYILEPHLLNEIPGNQFYHITHLIEKTHKNGGTVGVFPVSEKSWRDIGEWSEYLKYKKND